MSVALLLLLAVRWILNFRHHKMRKLGIIQLGRILIIEAKAEQIRTNTFLSSSFRTFDRMWFAVEVFLWLAKPLTTVLARNLHKKNYKVFHIFHT